MSKRFLSFVVLALGTLLVLAACGGQATPAPAAVTKAPAAVTKAPAAVTKAPAATQAPAAATKAPVLKGDVIRGGVLYDNWIEALGVEAPEGDQPLWKTQTTNTRTGADTWRCKECHGWDYRGVAGAYGKGSHKTGFVGVWQVTGQDANDILATMQGSTNPDHNFSKVMDEQALIDLSLFMSENLVDDTSLVSADKTAIGGNADSGKSVFNENCTECHGPAGLALNFSDETGPEYVGTLSKDNPWEFLHKARFGQPAVADMPSMVDLGLKDQEYVDLLAYVQTLPTESLITEGGVLYDNWMAALGMEAPAGDQPLWKTQTTNTRTGADTWRCKECHGWDYRGAEGAYGKGSHATGFKGVAASASLSEADITAWLNGTKSADHNFSDAFKEPQIKMMAAFIQGGLTDTSAYINADKTVKGGNIDHGKELYNGVCKTCHGADGKSLNFGDEAAPEYVGTIASDNPWEFWHKVSVGQPGKAMATGLNLDWKPQDFADLLTYAQTLPTK